MKRVAVGLALVMWGVLAFWVGWTSAPASATGCEAGRFYDPARCGTAEERSAYTRALITAVVGETSPVTRPISWRHVADSEQVHVGSIVKVGDDTYRMWTRGVPDSISGWRQPFLERVDCHLHRLTTGGEGEDWVDIDPELWAVFQARCDTARKYAR